MGLIVQKFGGSSVSDAPSIKRVAKRICEYRAAGHDVVVVVSAMGDSTDELIDLAHEISPAPPAREYDMLLTAGERISMALLAMAIFERGFEARSFTGSQAGVITDERHGEARIIDVTPGRIREALDANAIAIVAGFQGVSRVTKDVTTLGRGGSDTTAVALADALGADVCEIYSDVDGVFTADPRIVATARRIPWISSEEMLEMAAAGAKVLHLRAVEYARRAGVPIHARSSFSARVGTVIAEWPHKSIPLAPDQMSGAHDEEQRAVEDPIITGVAHDRDQAKVTVIGVPDVPGKAAQLFEVVAEAEANVDMIVQNVAVGGAGHTEISFTVPTAHLRRTLDALNAANGAIGFTGLQFNEEIGKVSLIGAGMRANPGVSATMFEALSRAGVNIEMISTSEIRISVVTKSDDVDKAVRAIHSAFGLDSEDGEAVVYGGTGR